MILASARTSAVKIRGGFWMEIITGVDRRRRWRAEEKLRIVAEAEQPGASFAAVARRHEVSRGLLWNWRQQVRRGELAPRRCRCLCRCGSRPIPRWRFLAAAEPGSGIALSGGQPG